MDLFLLSFRQPVEPSRTKRSFDTIRKSVKEAFVEIEENFAEIVIEDILEAIAEKIIEGVVEM